MQDWVEWEKHQTVDLNRITWRKDVKGEGKGAQRMQSLGWTLV